MRNKRYNATRRLVRAGPRRAQNYTCHSAFWDLFDVPNSFGVKPLKNESLSP